MSSDVCSVLRADGRPARQADHVAPLAPLAPLVHSYRLAAAPRRPLALASSRSRLGVGSFRLQTRDCVVFGEIKESLFVFQGSGIVLCEWNNSHQNQTSPLPRPVTEYFRRPWVTCYWELSLGVSLVQSGAVAPAASYRRGCGCGCGCGSW